MKDRLCLDYKYIFNDHMAKCSDQAKLYYIKLMFFATNGFVANPMDVLDSMKYDKGVFWELVSNDEILTLPGRDEVFITAYFIHTHFNPASWLSTPYATYWIGKLRTKPNGVATFKKVKEESEDVEPKEPNPEPEKKDPTWEELLGEDSPKNK